MENIDLHTHSTASDGTLTPSELYQLAREIGLRAVALTDHDNTDGLAEFLEAGREHPECEAVPGVELACSYVSKEIHIVGLFIDPRSAALAEFLERAREERARRNRDIFVRLSLLGYPLQENDPVFSGMALENLGRPHFARALMAHYPFPTQRSVFDKLLGNNRPAYVPRRLADPASAMEAIHNAGGVAVWAHPVMREHNDRAFLMRVGKKLAAMGLDALEGYYSMFGPAETQMVQEAAERLSLALSGGSDFHGENSPGVVLGFGAGGLRVPETLLPELKARRMRG